MGLLPQSQVPPTSQALLRPQRSVCTWPAPTATSLDRTGHQAGVPCGLGHMLCQCLPGQGARSGPALRPTGFCGGDQTEVGGLVPTHWRWSWDSLSLSLPT